MSKYFPVMLLSFWAVITAWSGYAPVDTAVWRVEMSSVFAIAFLLAFTFRLFRFSNTAYFIIFLWLVMHTIGAHYTFENVPFDIVSNFFGFERNHYDRAAHFVIGINSFMIAELALRKDWVTSKSTAIAFGILFIMAMANAWELIEWLYAEADGSDVGLAFLGSQGDIWDAQKDMLCDTLGSFLGGLWFAIAFKVKKHD